MPRSPTTSSRRAGFRSPTRDLKGIEYVYYQFFWYGPSIQYWSTGASGRGGRTAPTFADLMMADDGAGQARSFLATKESFTFVKELEANNLLVPVVGDFAGPKALRGVGSYVREHGADDCSVLPVERRAVSRAATACGVSSAAMSRRCRWSESSTFIRSVRNGNFVPGVGLDSELGNMVSETKSCSMTGAARLLLRSGTLGTRPFTPPAAPSRR